MFDVMFFMCLEFSLVCVCCPHSVVALGKRRKFSFGYSLVSLFCTVLCCAVRELFFCSFRFNSFFMFESKFIAKNIYHGCMSTSLRFALDYAVGGARRAR